MNALRGCRCALCSSPKEIDSTPSSNPKTRVSQKKAPRCRCQLCPSKESSSTNTSRWKFWKPTNGIKDTKIRRANISKPLTREVPPWVYDKVMSEPTAANQLDIEKLATLQGPLSSNFHTTRLGASGPVLFTARSTNCEKLGRSSHCSSV